MTDEEIQKMVEEFTEEIFRRTNAAGTGDEGANAPETPSSQRSTDDVENSTPQMLTEAGVSQIVEKVVENRMAAFEKKNAARINEVQGGLMRSMNSLVKLIPYTNGNQQQENVASNGVENKKLNELDFLM